MNLTELQREWQVDARVIGYSPHSTYLYGSLLKGALEYLGDPDVSSITSTQLRDYLSRIKEDRSLTNTSMYVRVCHLRSLFRYAVEQGYLEEDPARRVKYPRKDTPPRRFLSLKELGVFLATPIKPYRLFEPYKSRRDRTAFHLAAFTGLREGELCALLCEDVDLGRQQLTVRDSKTGEGRVVPLYDDLVDILHHYLLCRVKVGSLRECPALWLGRNYSTPFSAPGYEGAFKRHLAHCGLPDYGTHAMRHAFATYVLKGGASVSHVQHLLGHKRIETTQIYLHPDEDMLREAIGKHPLAGKV